MYITLFRILKKFFSEAFLFKHGFNLSPMYRRSTGRVYAVSQDLLEAKVKIPLSYKNKNYVNSIYGGSLSSATDPIYMIQLIQVLGDDYVVWDKAATIKFKRPAKETAYANFVFSLEEIEQIKKDIREQKEIDLIKEVTLTNKDGSVVFAEVSKTIYVADKIHYKEKRKARNTK